MNFSNFYRKSFLLAFIFFAFFTLSSFISRNTESLGYTDFPITFRKADNLNPIYIISSKKEFEEFLKSAPDLISAGPAIDFSKFTLLGSAHNCSGTEAPSMEKTINIDRISKKVNYSVEIKERGLESNQQQFIANYWILIPRIDPGIEVITHINHAIAHHD